MAERTDNDVLAGVLRKVLLASEPYGDDFYVDLSFSDLVLDGRVSLTSEEVDAVAVALVQRRA